MDRWRGAAGRRCRRTASRTHRRVARVALRGRCSGVVRNHRDPAQVSAMRRDHLGIGGLGDRGNRAAMTGKIFHLRRRGAGVGGDGDGAEFDAGEPGQHRLDAVVEMDQHKFAGLDAARGEARRPARRRGRGIRRSSIYAPAHRTAPRSETDGRGGSRRASAAATARRGRRRGRPRPAAVSFASSPPARLFGRFCHGRACPGHPRLSCRGIFKTWMPGTSPGMTTLL